MLPASYPPRLCNDVLLMRAELQQARKLANSDLVPVLKCPALGPDTQINDSLAIVEYLAEANPDLTLWPVDPYLRALARSAAAQMHSGFKEMRSTYHTNFVAQYTGAVPITDDAKKEIEKMLALWADSRKKTAAKLKELSHEDEGFLFGKFSIADAFFWPVLWVCVVVLFFFYVGWCRSDLITSLQRFRTYNLPLDTAPPEAIAWMKKMWNDPKVKEEGHLYYDEAKRPETVFPPFEDLYKGNPDVQYGQFTPDWEFEA